MKTTVDSCQLSVASDESLSVSSSLRLSTVFHLPAGDARLPLSVRQVIGAVEHACCCEPGDVLTRRRTLHIVRARQLVCWLLRARGMSSCQIGRLLRRDHATVLHAWDATEKRIEREEGFRSIVTWVQQCLGIGAEGVAA